MPVDVIQSTNNVTIPKSTSQVSRTGDFGTVLSGVLKPGPKLSEQNGHGQAGDGFKSTAKPERYIPLNRNLYSGAPSLDAKPVEAIGAATKHPVGPVRGTP